jgi:hypothetical protein
MAIDLYGKEYVDKWDYARTLITKGAKKQFYSLEYLTKGREVSLFIMDENKNYIKQVNFDEPGLYAIFQKSKGNKMECLYVGLSFSSVSHRLYRFGKELLLGFSRHDEDHPAAKKARLMGIKPKNLYFKNLKLSELPYRGELRFDLDYIDETVAHLMKSRFNTRKGVKK